MLLNEADYKQILDWTPQDALSDLETLPNDTAVRFGRGTYVSANWITLRQQNIHLFVEEADIGFVVFQAPIIIEGVNRARLTGLDLKSIDAATCLWLLGGQTFCTDLVWWHTPGTVPLGGGAVDSEFNRFVWSCSTRHSVVRFSTETTKGQPIMLKDGGYIRATATADGFRPQLNFGFGIGLQIAGCGGFIANLDISGPGKFTKTVGLEVARGGGSAFYLKTLGSPTIQDCGTGILDQSGGQAFIRASYANPLIIKNCQKGIQTTEGGRCHLAADRSVKYQNVDVRITQDRDEVVLQ